MKKKILAIALVICMAVIAITGASLAYLTDKDQETNVFTFGKVDIELLESTLHRQVDNASDEQIIADSATYQDYLAEQGKLMVPGRWVRKAPYIQNVGTNAAYVRIIVAIPVAVDDKINFMLYTTGLEADAFTMGETVTKGDYNYTTFTFTEPIQPGEVTYYAPFWQFQIKPELDNADLEGLQGLDVEHMVTVYAEAIQAETFENAEAAFAAFEVQYEKMVPAE